MKMFSLTKKKHLFPIDKLLLLILALTAFFLIEPSCDFPPISLTLPVEVCFLNYLISLLISAKSLTQRF